MPKVELANGVTLHYEQVGAGPDLVMIHGVGANLAFWNFKIVPMLWDRFRVLTYDLRGHGYSERTPDGYTCQNLATDLSLLLDELGIERANLVGHSYGADVALYFSYLFPERADRVVLIEAMVPSLVPTAMREEFARMEWAALALEKLGVPIPPARRSDTDYMLREVMNVPNKWGPLKDMPAEWTTKQMLDLYNNTTLLNDVLDVGSLTKDRLTDIRVPVHLVYDAGSILWRQAYRTLKRSLPVVTSTLLKTRLKDIAHLAPLEKPELVTEQILFGISPSLEGGA